MSTQVKKGIQAIHVKSAIMDAIAGAVVFRRRTASDWPDDGRNQRTVDALEELQMYVKRLGDEYVLDDLAEQVRRAGQDVVLIGPAASDYLSRLGFGHSPLDVDKQFDRLVEAMAQDLHDDE